jgi:STE24 endopeptidase
MLRAAGVTARRALCGAVGLLVAAAWVVALTRLWPSTVPSGLDLPEVDVDRLFSPAQLDRARDFSRVEQLLALAGQLVVLGALAVYARRGAVFARESAAGPIGTGLLLGMLGLALVWLASLPIRLVEFWWTKHHGIVRTDWVSFVVGDYWALGGQFVAASLQLAVIMGLARLVGRGWPWLAVPLVAAIQLGLVLLSTVLLAGLDPVQDPALRADAARLARIEGVRDVEVRVQSVHEETSAPNAEAIGLGRDGGHVILWDTVFRNAFQRREVDVILAHEIGHLRHRDTLRSIGFATLLLLPLALLVELLTRRWGGMTRPEAIPVALLVVVAFTFLTSPLKTAFSRDVEAAADWAALDATRDPRAASTMIQRFVPTALADPTPPGWAHLLYDDHPTLQQRIAMARAWRARHVPRPPDG